MFRGPALMGWHLLVAATAIILFAFLADFGHLSNPTIGLVIRVLLVWAAVDLISTMFRKPLVKPGPWAKSIYPDLDNE